MVSFSNLAHIIVKVFNIVDKISKRRKNGTV